MNKIFLSLITSVVIMSTSQLSANPVKINESFEYDAAKGWWWYKEKYKEKDKEFEVKQKFTPKEKTKFDIEQVKIKLLKSQNKKLKIIKERLEYAYPDITPKYTINKKTGKKCLANSSADCFVMPIQAEAQHMPALAKWLKNPTPENSATWLKLQAKYFNHLTNIGHGINFAYKNGGSEVYPTDNIYSDGDSLFMSKTDKWVFTNNMNILISLKDKVQNLIFIGKTYSLDAVSNIKHIFSQFTNGRRGQLNFTFVFPSEKALKDIEKDIMTFGTFEDRDAWKKFSESNKIIINKKLFNKFNIEITPTVVSIYKKNDTDESETKDYVWQKIITGPISFEEMVSGTIKFLVYNKIIEPKELSNRETIKNYKKMENKKIKIMEDKIYKSTNHISIEK